MALQLLASIYGFGSHSVGTAQGQLYSFPTQGILIRPAPASSSFNGVTVNSIIEVLPTGLNQPSKSYYAAATVSTLNTAANT